MTKFVFDETAFEHYCQWALQDVKTFNKIRDLLKDIKRIPFKGIGNPNHSNTIKRAIGPEESTKRTGLSTR
jgi:Txe/YoeB family toxin of Txe-Axe toxin-antitoxin module